MEKLRNFIQWFVTITAGILIICATACSLSGVETIPTATLWHVLLAGTLCTLATVLFFPGENAGKLKTVLGFILHYVSLCAIMVYCGLQFGWITWTAEGVAFMIAAVVIVHAFTTGVSYAIEKKQVDTMNRLLKEKYQSPPPEEPE